MKRTLSLLTLTALLLTAAMAQAETRCAVAMIHWQPREAVARLAAEKGWNLRRIKIDDGCYKVSGTDATGKKLEVKLHPGTLAIIAQRHAKNDHDDHDDHHARDDHDDR